MDAKKLKRFTIIRYKLARILLRICSILVLDVNVDETDPLSAGINFELSALSLDIDSKIRELSNRVAE